MGKLATIKHVRLVCHHYATVVESPADQGGEWHVYCPQCMALRQVVSVLTWGRAKCLTCEWAYRGRVDRAEAHAYGHSDRYPSHIVQAYEGTKLLFTTTLLRTQPELPLFQEEPKPPPF